MFRKLLPHPARLACGAVAMLCLPHSVMAQTPTEPPTHPIVREVDAQGRVSYSNVPRASAVSSSAEPLQTEPAPKRITGPSKAQVDAQEASRRLAETQGARERGVAPLGKERQPGAGPEAVNEAYWKRQEKLWRAVERAERRVEATRVSR